jgi:hypothetical protein
MKIQQTFLIAYCHFMTYCYSDTRLHTETLAQADAPAGAQFTSLSDVTVKVPRKLAQLFLLAFVRAPACISPETSSNLTHAFHDCPQSLEAKPATTVFFHILATSLRI